MDGRKILQAAEVHRSFLAFTGVTPCRAAQDLLLPSRQQAFEHMLWMAGEIPLFVQDNQIGKAMRFLAFVQGSKWRGGEMVIRTGKDLNRPDGSTYSSAV